MGIELPGSAEVEQAMAAWTANDPRLADLRRRYDEPVRALRHFGLLLWQDGDPRAAAKVLTGATALRQDDVNLWTDLSGALNAAGQMREAAACMEEALERDATHAENWMRLGSIRSALEDVPGAEAALKTALRLDPVLREAHLSLGFVYFGLKRFAEAAEHLGIVVATGVDVTPALRACYGQALGHVGDFAGSASVFAMALAAEPENAVLARKAAQVSFIAQAIEGRLDEATAVCRASPHVTAEAFETISRQAFHLLAAFGHRAAAMRLGEARLVAKPDDPECAYLLAVLRGEAIERTPDHYVASFFDQFAQEFDHQLVDVLGYDGFRQLAAMVEGHAERPLSRILDLGCGTGLAGPVLARPGRHLTGIDLSGGMLRKARERGCYETLLEVEASAYLAAHTAAFDLIFAADMLIYVGDLRVMIERAASALAPDGLFAFSIEAAETDIALLPSGRFAHGLAQVLALAEAAAFRVLETRSIPLRYETLGFVTGILVVLRKSAP